MKKKGNLFFLIKSLTRSEKRYFRLTAASRSGVKNYLRLFDFWDSRGAFDENVIRRHFKGEKFVTQLHVTKHYLTGLILRSLRNYHSKISKGAELCDLLRDIEILFRKELFDQCRFTIEKALDIARKYESYRLLLELCAWKRKLLLSEFGPAGSREAIGEILREEQSCLAKLTELNEYWRLADRMTEMALGRSDEVAEAQVDDFLSHTLLSRSQPPDSLQSGILFHHIRYVKATMKSDLARADMSLTDLIRMLEKNPHRIKDDPTSYITALTNRIGLALARKDHDTVERSIARVKAIPVEHGFEQPSRMTLKLRLRTYNMELEFYRDTGQIAQGVALTGEIRDFLTLHSRAIPGDYRLLLSYQAAYLHFMNRDHNKSLFWLNEIFTRNFARVREDIQSFAQLLNLIIHYELGNVVILKYAVDSCKRFLMKKRKAHQYERALFSFFSKAGTAHRDQHTSLLQQLQTSLFAGMSADHVSNVLDYLDFRGWIERRLKQE